MKIVEDLKLLKYFPEYSEAKCSNDYLTRLDELSKVLANAVDTSKKFSGIQSPTARHYYASILITTLLTRSIGFGLLLPYNTWTTRNIEYWDHGTAAVIARSIFEIRLCFHYLCIDTCSEDEWCCRLNMFHLHDCSMRHKIVDSESVEFIAQAQELKEILQGNSFFAQYSAKQQRKFLKAKTQFLYPLAKIAEKAGIPENTFKIIYPLLSSHVHCLPFSFYRAGQNDRGRGIYSKIEEGYLIMHMGIVEQMLNDSISEYATMWD